MCFLEGSKLRITDFSSTVLKISLWKQIHRSKHHFWSKYVFRISV